MPSLSPRLDWYGRNRRPALACLAAGGGLVLTTLLCLRLDLGLATAALLDLALVALLTAFAGFLPAMALAVLALAGLALLLPPAAPDPPGALGPLLAFLAAALAVAALPRLRADRLAAACNAAAQKLGRAGSFGWDPADGRLTWSRQSFRIFGSDPGTAPTLDLALARLHEEDRPAVRESFTAAAREGRAIDLETRLRLPDGAIRHLRFLARPERRAFGRLRYAGAVADVTTAGQARAAQAQSERLYRDLFDHMPIGLVQIDSSRLVALLAELRRQGVSDLARHAEADPGFVEAACDMMIVEAANAHTVRLFGAGSAEEMLGPTTRYFRGSFDTVLRVIESRYRGDEFFQEEAKMMRLDGRSIDVLFTTARPSALADKSLVGFIDLTEQVRARQTLSRLQAEFAHAARVSMLGELTASIAHEVNQPLAAIAANGQAGLRWLARPDPDLAELREAVESVVADSRRAADIIARIRAMASNQAPQPVRLLLDEVIRDALLFLRHEVQSRAATVLHHPAPGAPPVLGDRTQLQQVIVNLVVNALQALAESGAGRRRIVLRTRVETADSLRCTVEDSGPGIRAEHLPRLFDGFFTTKAGGMGMGLPICRTIIEAHGGRMAAASGGAEGGACLSFTLPIPAGPPA